MDNCVYHTPQALADLWGVCLDQVYRMLRAGSLRGFKIGRDWRIPDTAIDAYIEENSVKGVGKKCDPDKATTRKIYVK